MVGRREETRIGFVRCAARRRESEASGKLLEALKPARGDRRRAVHLLRAREEHKRRGGERRKVVRSKSDRPLRRFQAQSEAHWPRQPGIGGGGLWPCALVQSAEHDDIE